MFIKVVDNSAWDFPEPKSELIKIASNGLTGEDRRSFIKRAGASLLDKVDEMKFKPGEVPVHLIAVGATEFYGPNRNGDGFSKKACKDYHHYFVKDARFYRNHKNTDKTKSYGIVKASAYNEKMNRIELIVALNGDERAAKANNGFVADKEMEKLASGKDISVSMACLRSPDYPILTRDHGYKRIEDINTSDYVWTKEGNWKRVIELNRRNYTGNVYTIQINGLALPLELTEGHPLWAKCFKDSGTRVFTTQEEFDAAPVTWFNTEDLNVSDRLYYKTITKYDNYGAIDSVPLAKVLGYYLAEGSFGYNGNKACNTQFTCNISDSLPRVLPPIINELWPNILVQIKPRKGSEVALDVIVNNTDFSEFIRKYVGAGCKNKVIPPEIFNAGKEIKLAFLGAWLDGDGFTDVKGAHWSTANKHLVLQGRDLLASIGIPSSIYAIDHAKCATSGRENSGVEYTLNISKIDIPNLAPYSDKASTVENIPAVRSKPACMREDKDGMYTYRIKEITVKHVENIPVYNFEVEDDHSYSMAGIVSHNCRVPYDVCSYCGNKAVTRADYCDDVENGGHCKAGGLKHNMCKTASVDGNIVRLYADNTKPMFFDISNVVIPADRIAYTSGIVKRASNEVISGAELAELYGLYESGSQKMANYQPMDTEYYNTLRCLTDAVSDFHSGEFWKKTAGFAPVVDKEPMRFVKTANAYPYPMVVAALNQARHCMTPTQFLEITMNAPTEKVASIAEIIAPLSNEKFAEFIVDGDHSNPYIAKSNHVPEQLANWANMQKCASWYKQDFVKQAAKNSFVEEHRHFSPNYIYSMQGNSDVDTLCRDYAMYKVAFIHSLPKEERQEMANYLVARDYMSF